MWILYDVDDSGTLEIEEIATYIADMAKTEMSVTKEEVQRIFKVIDIDGDGKIDKEEMTYFLSILLHLETNLTFKSSNERIKRQLDKDSLYQKQVH